MISLSTSLLYYKREDICKALVATAEDKEIAVRFNDQFGKRPDVLKYPKDVLEFAKKGATSFHCSEELWHNPLQLVPGMKKKEMDELRKSWDLVLDIDCKVFEYSRLAADLVVKALQHHGVKTVSVKFSGNNGFHIAVPAAAFPDTVAGENIKDLFPDGPKRIAMYLQHMIKPYLAQQLLSMEKMTKLLERTGKKYSDVVKNNEFNPFEIVDIDTVLINSRHLYRMAYSLNEKSGLASIPLEPEAIRTFDKSKAQPQKVKVTLGYLDQQPVPGEATKLLVQALDFKIPQEQSQNIREKKEFEIPEQAIGTEFFPACIKKILQGLPDGKKRAVFVLINFLSSVGWEYDAIEDLLHAWNEKNAEPLREVYIQGQLRYHKTSQKKILPPNCGNKAYYADLGIKCDEAVCSRCKNPVNAAIKNHRLSRLTKKPVKKATKKDSSAQQ